MADILSYLMSALRVFSVCVSLGVGIGLGISLGFEVIMRMVGDGRVVLLTWAKAQSNKERKP